MKITSNILSKIIFFLIIAAGWGSGAWAQRIEPTFEDSYNSASDNWYYLKFENKGGSGYMYALDDAAHFKHANKDAQNPSFLWQLIGDNANGFKLVSMTGEYGYWNNDFLSGTSDADQAATFTLVAGSDANSWGVKKVNPSGGRLFLNPQGSNEIKTWDNDGGSRVRFEVAQSEDLAAAKETAAAAQTILGNNVHLVFEDVNHNPINSSVKLVTYIPQSGPQVDFTVNSPSFDFQDVLLSHARFKGGFDFNITKVRFDSDTNTLIFTLAYNKWVKIKAKNSERYISSDYAQADGRLVFNNNNVNPSNYAGFWRMVETGTPAANGGTNVQLFNAKFYDSKLLGYDRNTWSASSGNDCKSFMVDADNTEDYGVTFEQRTHSNGETFRVDWDRNQNSYINYWNSTLGLWNTSAGFGDANCLFSFVEVETLGEDVTIVINATGGEVIKYNTQCEVYNTVFGESATDVTLNNGDHYNFHNLPFLASLFSFAPADASKTLTIDFNEATQTLTFNIAEDPYSISFSSAPTADGWAPDTQWFTWRNNRNNQADQYNRTFISTSADAVSDECNLLPKQKTMPNDRGSYWCFVGSNAGFTILNAAYGPDFVLAAPNSGDPALLKMFHKGEVPSNYTSTFTAVENSVRDGFSHAYAIRLGTSGNKHLHVTQGRFLIYDNNGAMTGTGNDPGSSNRVEAVYKSVVNALPEYDVYTIKRSGAPNDFEVSYKTPANTFGKQSHVINGATFIVVKDAPVAKENFQTSSSEYVIEDVSVKTQDGHACKLLAVRLRDVNATEPWTVSVNGGYHVSYTGTELADGETFFLRPNVAPRHIDLTVDAPTTKFVWGPVIDEKAQTVTYEVRERAAELTNGWYQLQIADEYVAGLPGKIKTEEGNINTPANTLYLAPAVFEPGSNRHFKVTGVPTYGNEASTFVYVRANGSGNYTLVSPRTGAEITSSGFTFTDGRLTKSSGWSYESTVHPLEGPYLTLSGNQTLAYNVAPVDVDNYEIYRVSIVGAGATSDVRVNINNASVLGNKTVANGGYLFMTKGSNAPMRTHFSVSAGNVTIDQLALGDKTDGVTPITLTVTPRQSLWAIKVSGDAKTDADRVVYNNISYSDGDMIGVAMGSVPTALDFKTNVTNRFVWGPVINENNHTISFDIRQRPDEITDGWYQIQLLDDDKVASVNSRIAAINGAINTRSNYIYVLPLYNNTTTTLAKYGGVPTYADESASYFYITKSGNTLHMQSPDGRYFRNGTAEGGTEEVQNISSWQYNNQIFEMGGWTAPGYWSSHGSVGSIGVQGPNVASSGTGFMQQHYITKVDVDSKYDVYQVQLPTGQNKVRYVGADNHGSTEVYNNGFFFLTKDAEITAANFRFEGGTVVNDIHVSAGNLVTFDVTTPTYDHEIIHRQAKYYDMIESDANQPNHGFINEGEGWNVRTGEGGITIREQNTAVFEIPIYLKPGDSNAFQSYLPTNQLGNYQRWYNWDTDGLVNDAVLISPSRNSVAASNRYNNGHLTTNQTITPSFKLPADMQSYNVGLDISRLTDGQTYNSGALSGCRLEPTLGMRIVYQIRDAKLMAKDLKTKTEAGQFLEVHNIAFPNVKHGKYEDKTLSNLLPLDLDLNNYWIFDGNGETDADLLQLTENGSLQMVVELAGGSAPLQHVMKIPRDVSQASGNINYSSFNTGHFILFQYPDGGVVEPGSEATINVYLKKNGSEQKYNLAQFNLTFIGNAEPVPVTELPGSYRHPDALAEAFGAPVSELTFDNVANEEYAGHYRYPLNFKGVSYAFGNMQDRGWFASRGEYALRREAQTSGGITNIYYPVNNYLRNMANPTSAMSSAKEDDSYFLYIDAADQPGKVASIELEDALCAGSRLYCYGYIGCTSGGTQFYGNTNQNPTSILINVMGIDKNTNKEVLVYSYCPGIISSRGYDKDGRQVWSSALGRGTVYENHSGDNNYWSLWQQVGFSFAISGDIASQMKGYSVQIVNNAYNSEGADTVLDDFEIYVKKPGAEVQNTTPLCSDQIRHIKVITEYNTLIEATGEDTNHDGLMNVGFCFLDKEVFDQTLADNIADIDRPRNDANNAYNKAFGAALMGTRTLDRTNKDHAFHNFNIIRDGEVSTIGGETKQRFYTDIPQYSFKESGDDVVYRDSIRGERYIVFKESVAHGEPSGLTAHKWTAGKSYYLLFSTATISEEHVNHHDLGCTVFNLDDNRCSVMYEFTVAPPVSIKGDVEEITSGDEVVACAGQTPTITVNLNGRTETQDIVIKNLTYDWWLGYVSHKQMELENGVPKNYDDNGHAIFIPDAPDVEYNTLPATMQNYMNVWWGTYSADHIHLDKHAGDPIYLSDAMLEFRRAYPNATELVGVVPKHAVGDIEEYELTQEMIDCIAHFLQAEPESGYTPLVLGKKEMNLTLSPEKADADKVVHFVVIPIAPSIYSVDEDAIYCPDPQELKVKLLNEAPQLANGFANMPYPETMDNVPVRIGLQQINNVRHRGDATQRTLTVPVRKPFFAYPEGTSLIKSNDVTLYLVGTDDPAYKLTDNVTDEMDSGIFTPSDDEIEEMFVEAGEVKVLTVARGATSPTMQIIFNNSVQFREGYTYTFKVKFYEMQDDVRDRACEGSFVFDMKVVPEYQVWDGLAGNTDWTNDNNWRRADRTELHAGAEATGNGMTGATALNDASSYASNATNTTARSFVPMYFTNVLFKQNGVPAVELYKGGSFKRPVLGTNFLQGLESTATPAIVYDMAVTPVDPADRTAYNYDCNYQCELFDTYVANGVTFEPATQMGNAHYLTYNKAWVEYSLDANRWYTIASPLKKSVAGDWYSPTDGGKQLTPHFYDINFRTDLNDRFRPAYFQRSWDRDGNNIVYTKTGGSYDAYVRADWSNVYNDATVNYNTGGFSVKAELDYMDPADRPADDKVLVRLPKADTSYTYYDVAGATGQAADAEIGARTESYRLLSDDLRADGTGSIAMSVANATPDNNFLLLSNPFMAAMDMDEFFARNTELEEKYWIVSSDRQMVSVRSAADGEWITTGDAGGKYVAPLQGFFVKKKDAALNPGSLRAAYTAAMQTVVNPDPVNPGVALRAPASRATTEGSEVIRLTAERDGAESTALIVLRENSHDANVAGEDCEAFIDGNLYAHPTVYTAAGATAQTINVRKTLQMVPVGMISSDDSPATLRFDLSQSSHDLLYLYDSETDSYATVTDGSEMTMSGNNAGRYFLTTSIDDLTDDAAGGDAVRQGVWTLSGVYCGKSVEGLQPGIYVVDGVKMNIGRI